MARKEHRKNNQAGIPISAANHVVTVVVRRGRQPGLAIHALQPEPPGFTWKDHLRVQREIERRAHHYWHVEGGGANHDLSHWLRAERELLEEFILSRMPAGPEPPERTALTNNLKPRNEWPSPANNPCL
jgi:hypothetical protein